MKSYELAVIGGGSWGTALALHLARKGISIGLWDCNETLLQHLQTERCNNRYLPDFPFPASLHIEFNLENLVKKAKDILIVVPSYTFEALLLDLLPHMELGTRISWATKGIDPDTHLLLHTLVEKHYSKAMPFAVLSGPSFAKEVAAGLPTAVTLAGNNEAFLEDLKELFDTPTFSLQLTSDYIGVQIGGTAKNIVAIAVGISDGLGYGTNMRAVLMTQGINEMASLGQVLGANPETFIGLSGLGDLVLTCTDVQSRNRRFGFALGQGFSAEEAEKTIGQSIEGKNNVAQILALANQCQVSMPIVTTVFNILNGQVTAKEGIMQLLKV
jgi:glycerol-3-phosphate dehydrogenase (NAD(P)+)